MSSALFLLTASGSLVTENLEDNLQIKKIPTVRRHHITRQQLFSDLIVRILVAPYIKFLRGSSDHHLDLAFPFSSSFLRTRIRLSPCDWRDSFLCYSSPSSFSFPHSRLPFPSTVSISGKIRYRGNSTNSMAPIPSRRALPHHHTSIIRHTLSISANLW